MAVAVADGLGPICWRKKWKKMAQKHFQDPIESGLQNAPGSPCQKIVLWDQVRKVVSTDLRSRANYGVDPAFLPVDGLCFF